MADQTQTYGHDFGDAIDKVKPKHYTFEYEPIDLIDSYQLPYYEGTIVAYVARYHFKDGKSDLAKSLWYTLRLMNIIRNKGIPPKLSGSIGGGKVTVEDLVKAMSLNKDQEYILKIMCRASCVGNASERLTELNNVCTRLSQMIEQLAC